mgnify:CR=1 FL=1
MTSTELEGTDCFKYVVFNNNQQTVHTQKLEQKPFQHNTGKSPSPTSQQVSPNFMQQLQVPCSPDIVDSFVVPTMGDSTSQRQYSPEPNFSNNSYESALATDSRSSHFCSPESDSHPLELHAEMEILKAEREEKKAKIKALQVTDFMALLLVINLYLDCT